LRSRKKEHRSRGEPLKKKHQGRWSGESDIAYKRKRIKIEGPTKKVEGKGRNWEKTRKRLIGITKHNERGGKEREKHAMDNFSQENGTQSWGPLSK